MPDPSGRYSEDLVEMAARALFEAGRLTTDDETWQGITEDDRDSYREATRAQLDALAAAGLLLPEGAGTRIEWGVTWHADDPDGIRMWQGGMTHRAEAEQRALSKLGEYGITRYRLQTREHRDFADGSCLSGPWSPIPPETGERVPNLLPGSPTSGSKPVPTRAQGRR
jgi:hypothetical protein